MKRLLLITALLSVGIAPAYADTYVIVDDNNTVVSGAIVCDAGTCGDRNSLYSQLTLQEGQRYVLQNKTDSLGNDVGVGVQPNQIIKVKEEVTQNTFIVLTPDDIRSFKVDKVQPIISTEPTVETTKETTPTDETTEETTPTDAELPVEIEPVDFLADWITRWKIFWLEFRTWLFL